MNRKLMVVLAAALLLVPTAPLVLATAGLTVQTGPKYYNAGDAVAIGGTAPANATVHLNVTLASVVVFSENATANATGVYQKTYTLPATAATGIYRVEVTSGALTAETVFMVTTISTDEMANSLIEAAVKSQLLAEETIQAILDDGYTVPAAVNASMTHGADAIVEAEAFYTQGQYMASAQAARRAMVHFKNAMVLAIRAGNIQDETLDENQTLTLQVNKLKSEAERISEVLVSLSDSGKNVTEIEVKVASANAKLTNATALIADGDYKAAAVVIKEARDDLHDAMQLIKGQLKEVRRSLMEQFKERLRARLNSTETDLESLGQRIGLGNVNVAKNHLGAANGFINRAEAWLKSGKDDDALNDLGEALDEFNQGLGAIDNNGYALGMKNTNAIRAQIQVLEKMAERLRAHGLDASGVEAKIQGLRTLIEEGMEMMENGAASGANSIFGKSDTGWGTWRNHRQQGSRQWKERLT